MDGLRRREEGPYGDGEPDAETVANVLRHLAQMAAR
jgi:hypothetical protein